MTTNGHAEEEEEQTQRRPKCCSCCLLLCAMRCLAVGITVILLGPVFVWEWCYINERNSLVRSYSGTESQTATLEGNILDSKTVCGNESASWYGVKYCYTVKGMVYVRGYIKIPRKIDDSLPCPPDLTPGNAIRLQMISGEPRSALPSEVVRKMKENAFLLSFEDYDFSERRKTMAYSAANALFHLFFGHGWWITFIGIIIALDKLLPLEFVRNIGFGTILCNIYAPWAILAYPVSYYRNRRIVNDIKGNAQTEGPTSNDSNNVIIEMKGEKKVIPTLL